jgi:predicted O-methyltransferase YrrM
MSEFPNWFKITAEHYFEKHIPTDKPLKVLQIGVFTGDATKWLLDNRENIVRIDDVDTWQGSDEEAHESMDFNEVKEYYLSRFNNESRVVPYQMTSDLFFAQEAPKSTEKYDFIYIDGDHTATQVTIDALNALRWVKQGGIIAFDDYTWSVGLGEFYEPALGIKTALTIWKNKFRIIEAGSQVWIERF